MATRRVWLLFIVFILCFGLVQEVESVNAASAGSLRLGVNDKLTEIEAVSIKDTYYVPLRDLAEELNLNLTGLSDGIMVEGMNGPLKLMKDNITATLLDGNTVPMDTFLKNGKLMVPVRITTYLGFEISFNSNESLLRIKDASAILDDPAFVSQYKKELKPEEFSVIPPKAEGNPGKTIYLSFDDGPTATTFELLDVLAKHDVKATFFMLGKNMNAYPAQVKRTAKEGHALALHGMTHRKEKFYASPSAALSEMDNNNAILKKITGQSTTLIRPPYGSKPYFTRTFRDKVLTAGYHLWDWNVDSEDWKYKDDSEKVYISVMNQIHKLQKTKVNPVILMHDQKATLKVLPRILETLKKEGYEFQIITPEIEPVNFWKDKR